MGQLLATKLIDFNGVGIVRDQRHLTNKIDPSSFPRACTAYCGGALNRQCGGQFSRI